MIIFDQFRASSPGRQIVVVAVIGCLICAVLVAIYVLAFHKPYGVLYSDLREADAASIVAELDKKKAPYKLEDGGRTILVPKAAINADRLALMSTDLPLKGAVGFELFNKSDMGLTEFEQRINYQRALQGELARTIMSLDAVESARVHLTLTEPTVFRDDHRPPRASVTITTRRGLQLPPGSVQGIQRLVASAVPDLDIANVVILDSEGRTISDGQTANILWSARNPDKQAAEDAFAVRVRQALARSYPDLHFEVAVAKGQPIRRSNDGDSEVIDEDQGTQSKAAQTDSDDDPLIVTVTVDRPISVGIEKEVRSIATRELDLNPDLGDVVTVSTPTGAAGTQAEDSKGVASTRQAGAASGLSTRSGLIAFAWPVAVFAVMGVLLVLAFVMGRGRKVTTLSEEERRNFSDRLRTLVDTRDENAARI